MLIYWCLSGTIAKATPNKWWPEQNSQHKIKQAVAGRLICPVFRIYTDLGAAFFLFRGNRYSKRQTLALHITIHVLSSHHKEMRGGKCSESVVTPLDAAKPCTLVFWINLNNLNIIFYVWNIFQQNGPSAIYKVYLLQVLLLFYLKASCIIHEAVFRCSWIFTSGSCGLWNKRPLSSSLMSGGIAS